MGECAPSAAAAAPTTTKTSVWWDIDKCAVPRGRCDPHRIAHNLIAALAAAGYAGPVSIAAYGDAARVPPPVLAALSATGICLNHVPAGSKDTSEKRMLVDMLFWAFDNPPPGNYLLISGDQDLSDLLHRLRMKRYDILLERYMNSDKHAPPVRIIVADGAEDVTIKISDEGGGIPRSGLSRIFTYLYSTAENPPDLDEHNEGVSMAGYGCGIPISRLYARYFGGDLQIISMEGYGTDAYLHLSRLGDSEEPLP